MPLGFCFVCYRTNIPTGYTKQIDFGNFVSNFQPIFAKIGNFVIKIRAFGLFLVLAKNLTMASRPNEMKRTDKTNFGTAATM
jgi:hypothetical protein